MYEDQGGQEGASPGGSGAPCRAPGGFVCIHRVIAVVPSTRGRNAHGRLARALGTPPRCSRSFVPPCGAASRCASAGDAFRHYRDIGASRRAAAPVRCPIRPSGAVRRVARPRPERFPRPKPRGDVAGCRPGCRGAHLRQPRPGVSDSRYATFRLLARTIGGNIRCRLDTSLPSVPWIGPGATGRIASAGPAGP